MSDVSRRRISNAVCALSDEELEARLENPRLIGNPEECIAIQNELESDIIDIEAQLEGYKAECLAGTPDTQRVVWARKAATALGHRKGSLRRVERRLHDLTTVPRIEATNDLKVAREGRLRVEASARIAGHEREMVANRAKLEQLDYARSWRRQFVRLAKARLPQEVYNELVQEAKKTAKDAASGRGSAAGDDPDDAETESPEKAAVRQAMEGKMLPASHQHDGDEHDAIRGPSDQEMADLLKVCLPDGWTKENVGTVFDALGLGEEPRAASGMPSG